MDKIVTFAREQLCNLLTPSNFLLAAKEVRSSSLPRKDIGKGRRIGRGKILFAP